MNNGDIILLSFPFTNLIGNKYRPAVVLYSTVLDLTACFITTQMERKESTDIFIKANRDNGLKLDSIIRTSKVTSIDKQLAKGLLGSLSNAEIDE